MGAFETENQGVFNDIHMNAWTEDRWNAGEKIDYPALSLSKSTSHNDNDYFIQDGSYLRLKNAEIAYTLPHKISKKAFAEKFASPSTARIYSPSTTCAASTSMLRLANFRLSRLTA